MESLPPVVWHQIATKDDLAALEERLDSRFALLRGEFADRYFQEMLPLCLKLPRQPAKLVHCWARVRLCKTEAGQSGPVPVRVSIT